MGDRDGALEGIGWACFFKVSRTTIAFLYQDRTDNGAPSRFNKFVARDESGRRKVANLR